MNQAVFHMHFYTHLSRHTLSFTKDALPPNGFSIIEFRWDNPISGQQLIALDASWAPEPINTHQDPAWVSGQAVENKAQ